MLEVKRIFERLPLVRDIAVGFIGLVIGVAATLGITFAVNGSPGATGSSVEPSVVSDWPSRDDLKELRELQPTRFEPVDNGNAVRVYFTTGTPTCFGVHTEVEETDVDVTIRVFQGVLPNAPVGCTRELVSAATVVPLAKPLGVRVIKGTPRAENTQS